MNTTTATPRLRAITLKSGLIWAIRLLLVLAFAKAGFAKLTSDPMMVQVFEHIGIGQWFRYVTGLTEITGALLLLIPRSGFLGGLLLAVTMLFGIATHLFVIGGNPLPAIVLAVLSAIVAYALRPASLTELRDRLLGQS